MSFLLARGERATQEEVAMAGGQERHEVSMLIAPAGSEQVEFAGIKHEEQNRSS
jgi:hypothetical protein